MAIGCEDVSARMVDLLYGEIPADERAPLEAHVTGCARCRAELAGLRATRAAARRTLDADAPPARAHQAILRAAAAAVAAQQAQPVTARPAPARPSLWERLRSRWTLPTFATVGAVAVVLLASKVFLEPDKTIELGRQTVHPAPAEAPAGPAGPAAVPQPEAQASGNAAAAPAEKRPEDKDDLRFAERPPADQPFARPTAAPPHERKRAAPSEGRGGLGNAKGAAAPARQPAKAYLDSLLDEGAGASPTPKPSKRAFAPPPPARAEPPSAPAPAGARGKQAISDEVEANAEPAPGTVGGARLEGGSGAATPPLHAAAKAKKASAPDDDFAQAPAASASAPAAAPPASASPAPPAAAREEEKKSRRADAKSETKPAGESPVARADRLYAEGRWAEAARAYRELLRHDPRNADAARWRQRLAAAEAELAPAAPPAATAPAQ